MATIQKFEDLIVWQKARELTKEIYRIFSRCSDYGFKDQIQRSSVSVVSNIAEGFERGTRAEFINYLFIAKGSCGEVRAQLYAALDIGYLNVEMFKRLKSLSEDCSVLIWRFIQSLQHSSVQGLQFKKGKNKPQLEREAFDVYLKQCVDTKIDFKEMEFRRFAGEYTRSHS